MRVHSLNKSRQFCFQLFRLAIISYRLSPSNLSWNLWDVAPFFRLVDVTRINGRKSVVKIASPDEQTVEFSVDALQLSPKIFRELQWLPMLLKEMFFTSYRFKTSKKQQLVVNRGFKWGKKYNIKLRGFSTQNTLSTALELEWQPIITCYSLPVTTKSFPPPVANNEFFSILFFCSVTLLYT